MKSPILFILFLFNCTALFTQEKSHFNITFGLGPSYFFNDKTLNRYIDNTKAVGVNYEFINHKQNLYFNPALSFQATTYHSVYSDKRLVHVDQHSFNLNLDVLMRSSKRVIARVGLLFATSFYNEVMVSQKNYSGRGRHYYGSSEISQEYSPTRLQAGYTLGLSFPFKLFKRVQKFNVKLVHLVTPLVNKDYYLSKAMIGEDLKVLSTKARPIMLTLGFDISLEHRKKKEKIKEE